MSKKFYNLSQLPPVYNTEAYSAKITTIHKKLVQLNQTLSRLPRKTLLIPIHIAHTLNFLATQCPSTTLEQLLHALTSGRTCRLKLWAMNFLSSIDYIENSPQSKKISDKFLSDLQFFIEKDHNKKKSEVGKIRRRQNWIGPKGCNKDEALFCPPPPKKVKKWLNKLYIYCTSNTDPLLIAGVACAQLLMIHPFMDGNGRLARMIIPALFKNLNILTHPIIFLDGIFFEKRLEYIYSLYLLTTENQWNNWLHLYLKAVNTSCNITTKQLAALIKYQRKLSTLISSWTNNKDLETKIIDCLYKNPIISKTILQKQCVLEQTQVIHLLLFLEQHGLVRNNKSKIYLQPVLIDIMKTSVHH